jgi:hypothetical protein
MKSKNTKSINNLLYTDEDIKQFLQQSMREHVLYLNHPDIIEQLNKEVETIVEGLTISDMRKILATKIGDVNSSLIKIVDDYKKNKALVSEM